MSGLVSIHFLDRLLAVGSTEGQIKVWDLEKSRTFNLVGHTQSAMKVWILPGKVQLLSCSADATMVF
jgi:WD40 repeat protein